MPIKLKFKSMDYTNLLIGLWLLIGYSFRFKTLASKGDPITREGMIAFLRALFWSTSVGMIGMYLIYLSLK